VLYADLVVGADGVKSTLQKAVMGLDDRPTPTGNTTYRTVVCTDLMSQGPELRPFVETPMTAWMAPGRHHDDLLHPLFVSINQHLTEK